MENTFLILGFPRSRTLWLSQFFTLPGVCQCEHEATQWAGSSQEFWDRAEEQCQEPIYGNSDSAQIYVLPALLALRPLTKVVWVERPIVEVCGSLKKAGFPFNQASMEMLLAHRNKYHDLFDFVVPFNQLGSLSVIAGLWKCLVGNVPFNLNRWAELEATKLALTYQDYDEGQRQAKKLLEFINKEGEIKCQI